MPTVIEPLREEWEAARTASAILEERGDEEGAHKEIEAFQRRLCSVRVLDPACGSGNFLYVTLEHLKRLEGEVTEYLAHFPRQLGLDMTGGYTVTPQQLLGLEVNPRAAAIADVVLRAPFDGVITARHADRGALVGNNQNILTVQNNHKLRPRIAVPEIYTASGTAGKQASFRVEAYPEKLFSASLTRKSGSIDPVTRTEQWEYAINNKDGELKAGSFAYLKLDMQRTGNSILVPPVAVATNQERKFVIKVVDGKTEWIDVRQGMSTEKGIEIFGTVNSGDTLLVRATDERKPGSTAYWKVMY